MTDELGKFKLWVIEILFIEEDLQEFESRGIDPIYEDSQVFVVGTVEFERSESRKDMAYRAEVGVGILLLGRIASEGRQIRAKVLRGWSGRRCKWPSPRAK